MLDLKSASDTILSLLDSGHALRLIAEDEDNVHKHEAIARQAIGYFAAAAALLNAFSELHNQLIEHPQFVAARKFQRQYRF